jgi:hypothetical protein
VLSLFAVALMVLGGFLLWANGEKNADGYVTTSTERFATPTSALATENLDIDLDGAGWLVNSHTLGKLRLKVAPATDKPVFVGIARTSDVSRYLRGTAHATLTDVDTDPFSATYRTAAGDRSATAPASQRFWAASATGGGTQSLTWKIRSGNWSVVVMNADGSSGVDAGVSAGADLPVLPALGWGVLGGGVVLLLAGGVLIVRGGRGPRQA